MHILQKKQKNKSKFDYKHIAKFLLITDNLCGIGAVHYTFNINYQIIPNKLKKKNIFYSYIMQKLSLKEY